MADNYLERHRQDYEERKQRLIEHKSSTRIRAYRSKWDDH